MHLLLLTLVLSLLPSSQAAPTRRIDPLLQSLFATDSRGSAADLSYAQAQKAMLDNPNLLQHLTEAGRHRLEETVKRAEEDQLRAALRGRDASVGGFGGAVVLAAAEVEQKQQGGPGVGRWRDKKARKSVRLTDGKVFLGSGATAPSTRRTPQLASVASISHSLPRTGTTPFFTSLRVANDALKHPSTASPLHVQSPDDTPSIFSDPITWVGLPTSHRHEGYWEIPVDSLSIQGHKIDGPFSGAIFDVASNRLALPTSIAEQIYARIPSAEPLPSTSATSSAISYSYPCLDTILLSLTFASKSHAFLPVEFNITPLASVHGAKCLGAVYGLRVLDGNGGRVGVEEVLS